MDEKKDDVFYIPVRRCRRCGGILMSAQGLRDGLGCVCKRKERAERSIYDAPGQTTFFDDKNWCIGDEKQHTDDINA